MLKFLKKVDKTLDREIPLFLLILLLIILRLPNFFEPYWYGDEAIYLTIGNALRFGEKLYTDIIDHKTPIIYFLAKVPNQLSFRFLNLLWTALATVSFYFLAKKIFKKKSLSFFSTLIFVLLTSLPWFEGYIPNGELFVIGFVMAGAYLLSNTNYFNNFLKGKIIKTKQLVQSKKSASKKNQRSLFTLIKNKKEELLIFIAGCFFALAILTKVPALLDFAAFMAIAWFSLVNTFSFSPKKLKNWKKQLLPQLKKFFILLAGVLTPILLSVIYFASKGSAKDYLDFGLLYNFRYASSWQLNFTNPVLIFAFSLKGKLILLSLLFFLLSFAKKLITPKAQLLIAWFALSLFASLLSNRPYPHYFLQIMPAFSLLIIYLLYSLLKIYQTKKKSLVNIVEISLASLLILIAFASMKLLKLGLHPVKTYYQNFYLYATRKLSEEDYYQSFNNLMRDNYKASKIIQDKAEKRIFIWGNNPMLYAHSKTIPTGRFTVAFHIKDFNAYRETMDGIKKHQPKIIVVMKDEQDPFPEFYRYLYRFYKLKYNLEYMFIFEKVDQPESK
ncbi:MAG: hypothetical protein PVJ09_03695 [Candidatus Woesebacteria bacterium]|jgi:hypothetical protein